MVMKKIIKAEIECVKWKHLRKGDYVLYSNFKCKVVCVFNTGEVSILQDEDFKESLLTNKFYMYYKINKVIEEENFTL